MLYTTLHRRGGTDTRGHENDAGRGTQTVIRHGIPARRQASPRGAQGAAGVARSGGGAGTGRGPRPGPPAPQGDPERPGPARRARGRRKGRGPVGLFLTHTGSRPGRRADPDRLAAGAGGAGEDGA
ncbi:hypothetical protein THSYN_12460 [Candidatus Thiodictyon syntrophicum]|uniref:Uncharacterized protein n=1 Tax=Candidatus Thiodictyon syntrophicum TaxID=1166950 RepID=A0A2K8U819_9GAMM|nr:hypothetical protein THSYN_12460 [Candidatus Thiodictyon syntrophicum]